MVWLSKIALKNYRPYYGDQTINLPENSRKKFTIFEAKADTGKTKMLSAIAWCLYGKEVDSVHGRDLHPLNLKRKDELKEGERDNMVVEITLNDDETLLQKYVIRRTLWCVKRGRNVETEGEPETYIEEWEDNHNCRLVRDEYAAKKINAILPEDIHLFFLFEGEKLEKHFSFNDNNAVKHAIEKISQLQQIESAIKHLAHVRGRVFEDHKGPKNDEMERLQQDIDEGLQRIEEIEETVRQADANAKTIDVRIREIDEKLLEVNVALIQSWAKERNELDAKIKQNNAKSANLRQQSSSILLDCSPHKILQQEAEKLLDAINAAAERRELPPNIQKAYISELLEFQECICGRSLNHKKKEDAGAIKKLEALQEKKDLSGISQLLNEGKFALNARLKTGLDAAMERRGGILKEIKSLESDINHDKARIEELDRLLAETNEATVTALNNERISQRAELDSLNARIGRSKGLINTKKANLDTLERQKESIAKGQKDYLEKAKIARFIDRSITHLVRMKEEILHAVREKVEMKTFESFKKLHWDKKNYARYLIDEDYNMRLEDQEGNERIYDISSGTKQVLLLSFIAALADISGFKFPVFIDTPLANTDNEQRANIAKNLPSYLENTQVLMLMKDQEYTPEFRKVLLPRIAAEFKMQKQGTITTVTEWTI